MTELRITIKNTSDTNGTFTTPFWFGFHNGLFDTFDTGETASAGLEALAEDGNSSILGAELLAADGDGQGFVLPGSRGPIGPGEYTSTSVEIDGASTGYVNYAAMLLPSNDAFVGNSDPSQLFTVSGHFLGESTTIISGNNVYDAGTELNTEEDAAFLNQTAPNTGVDEGGVVHLHPGFNGSLGNPVGDGDQNVLGGTNAFGEFIDPIAADFTQPGTEIAEIHINTVKITEGTRRIDFVWGGHEDDLVTTGRGADLVFGGNGWDVIDGGGGWDVISGGNGDDEISGGSGWDRLYGGNDDDRISGGNGRDSLYGGRNDDRLAGEQGKDYLVGGSGNDALSGGSGRDHLEGGSGDDLLSGDAGRDTLYGGFGSDTFLFTNGGGRDLVVDFQDGTDHLAIDIDGFDSFDDVISAAKQTNHGVTLNFGDEGDTLLRHVDLEWLDESDFIFA